MRFRVGRVRELGEPEWALWKTWSGDSSLASPYFAPQFTRIVGEVRSDAGVAVLEEGGHPVGFFSFERRHFGRGRPPGVPISDYQGVVHRPGLDWDAAELVRACGLRVFEFDHFLAAQAPFAPFHRARSESPLIDLSKGFSEYRDELRRRSHGLVQTVERKMRKLEREVGPLRFELSARDERVLRQLREWKSAQYRATGKRDVFRLAWVNGIVERILATDESGFAGVLSALWAGDELVAAHFGMRSDRVLHWWFPSYSPRFAPYSPGSLLLWRIIEALDAGPVRCIDLGRGDDPYKERFRNGGVWLAQGWIELPSWVSRARRASRSLEAWARQPLPRAIGRPVVHLARRMALRLRKG
jgi:CelD/BcsL family acetyltransferase involved in cellulose biosynthesis